MPKSKPQPKSEKREDQSRSKERAADLPVKDEKAAAVKGGLRSNAMNHNETLVGA